MANRGGIYSLDHYAYEYGYDLILLMLCILIGVDLFQWKLSFIEMEPFMDSNHLNLLVAKSRFCKILDRWLQILPFW